MASAPRLLNDRRFRNIVAIELALIGDVVMVTPALRRLRNAFPGIRIVAFGHMGDGNIHYNVSLPDAAQNKAFLAQQEGAVNKLVYAAVRELNGSISAEHGLGQLKRDTIRDYKDPLELELMRSVKQALDPHGLMNPGKVL